MKELNIMTKKEATRIVGGLSDTEKMPCKSYNLPAELCITGSKLRKINNSVCSDCYACKGRYVFPTVQKALYRRHVATVSEPRWIEAMITLIIGMPFFRWHDSGDLQDVEHLRKIITICGATPNTKHWLPTRENRIVYDYWQNQGQFPLNLLMPNLCIRLSGTMIDGKGPYDLAKKMGCQVSEVGTTVYTCPASNQDNQCKDCRMCWNQEQFNVVYHKH